MDNTTSDVISLDQWETWMFGCNHKQTMTNKQISEPIETRFDPSTGRMENYYVCRECADGKPTLLQNIGQGKLNLKQYDH
jgi:hypothetical protein